MTLENSSILRTINNYLNASKYFFGVIEKCIFNNIPGYHVISNASVDPMHSKVFGDKVLNNLIYKYKFFTIEILNERICIISSSFHKNSRFKVIK